KLNDELTIKLPTKAGEYEARLILEGKDPKAIANWANAYTHLALQAASETLISGLSGEVKIRQLSLDDQISTLQQVAEKIRQDRIIRVTDALAIAESINLESPSDSSPLIAINTQGLNTESVNSGSLLYLRGAQALRSELEQLKKR